MKLALLSLMVFLPLGIFAADAGSAELGALSSIVTGNVGLTIGLILAVWGIFKAVVGGETGAGMLLIVCGVLLTIFPGVFNSFANTLLPLVRSITGG